MRRSRNYDVWKYKMNINKSEIETFSENGAYSLNFGALTGMTGFVGFTGFVIFEDGTESTLGSAALTEDTLSSTDCDCGSDGFGGSLTSFCLDSESLTFPSRSTKTGSLSVSCGSCDFHKVQGSK